MKVLKEVNKSFDSKKGKCTKCNYRESLDESKTTEKNFSEITALADDCGKNTFKVSARDIRFTFKNEGDKTKFVNKLLSRNIPHNELPFGIISINKSDALDESKSTKESITHSPLSTIDPVAYAVKLLYQMDKFVTDVYDSQGWLMNGVPDGEFQETTAEEAMKNYAEHDWLITDFEGNFSTENFKDFLDTFKYCTRSKSYDQAERARIIAEAQDLLKEYSDKIDEDTDEDHAFSKEEVIAQLKQELPTLGNKGKIKYGYKSEAEAAVDFLEEIYAIVELDKVGSWFQIDYAELLKD